MTRCRSCKYRIEHCVVEVVGEPSKVTEAEDSVYEDERMDFD
jgi:hypothetical protein